MIQTLVLATHNKGKKQEFDSLLKDLVGEIKTAGELGLVEPPEDGTTFLENATMKAVTAMKATGLPTLADDSGICVNALDGAPGVYTADWAGVPRDFQKAMSLVHEKMGNAGDKGAQFVCMLVLAYPDGRIEKFEGVCEGSIVWPGRGVGGHGYDSIFLPDGANETFAEMNEDKKNGISHRGKAVEKFITYLKGEKT